MLSFIGLYDDLMSKQRILPRTQHRDKNDAILCDVIVITPPTSIYAYCGKRSLMHLPGVRPSVHPSICLSIHLSCRMPTAKHSAPAQQQQRRRISSAFRNNVLGELCEYPVHLFFFTKRYQNVDVVQRQT